ncbi:hypothetical protein LUZ60_012620 [Juncus effusus]|nr:hypothetical protein LUZ60_012620 [Juncus effusus]
MASFQTSNYLLSLLIFLSPLLITAKTAPVVADAPGPASDGPLDFIGILEKGSQYTTFLRLLKSTQVGEQVVNQLENSSEGLTVMAPTDNAFSSLKPGTLNKFTNQQQSELVMYHILPKYYSFYTFQLTSNPVPTQATSEEGTCTINITSSTNQANISTGIDDTSITNALYSDFPLAVYSVDKVLMPPDLFGPHSAKSHSATSNGNKKNNSTSALSPSSDSEADADTGDSKASGVAFRGASWSSLILGFLFMGILNLL